MVYLKQGFTPQDYVPVLASSDYIFHLNDDLKSTNELKYAKVLFLTENESAWVVW